MDLLNKFCSLLFLAVLCGVCCSCSKEEEPADPGMPEPTEKKLEVQDRPTDWIVVTEGVDLQSTMIADVAINRTPMGLEYESDKQDLMAAFVDGSCRAVAAPWTDEATGKVVFPLTIKKLWGEDTGKDVWLKFYSAKLRHIFTCEKPLKYEDESSYGSLENPYQPTWSAN